jgi:uncharacterized protein YecT (DUF1311 family)
MKRLALLLLATISLPAFAADRAAEERELASCIDKAGGVDLDVGACYGAASENADGRMNAAYRRLRDELEPAAFAKLQVAQRKWVEFRDAESEARAGFMDMSAGTLDRMLAMAADYEIVRVRADQLEAWQEY